MKFSEMPNFLILTVWTQFPIEHDFVVWQVTPVGMGNSPPEIKVADSPEIAVRLGSASVRTTPALSIARMVAVNVGRPFVMARGLKLVARTSDPCFAANGVTLSKSTT